MNFHSPDGRINNPEISADYESAEKFDKLRIGSMGVYFPDGFVTKFIPYSYIDQAFIRIHEVNGRMCCGTAVFSYFRLVLVHSGKEFANYMSENENNMDNALAAIGKKCSSIKIGIAR